MTVTDAPLLVTVDASVVLARLLVEPRPEWVDEAFADVEDGRLGFLAPSLLWLEIGNRLVRSPNTGDELALEALLRAEAFPVTEVDAGRPARLRALQLGRDHDLSMYDATYLAVAEATDSRLLTLDQRLARAAESMGFGREGYSPRVSEPAATYDGRPVDRTSIAAIGQALAEMRKEYSL